MQQARHHHFLRQPVLLREVGALQQMLGGRREAQIEEVEQCRPLGHLRQARVFAHQERLAGGHGEPGTERTVAVGQIVEQRLGGDAIAELLNLLVLERVGALGKRLARGHGIILAG